MHLPKRLARPGRLLPITIAAVVLLATAGGVGLAVHLANRRGLGPFDRTQFGTPAISVTRPGQVPAFTRADVRDFFTSAPNIGSVSHILTSDGQVPRIQTITFMSREQAQAYTMLHDSLNGLPADALVCVVVVNGPLILVGPGVGLLHNDEGLIVFPGTPMPTPTPTAVVETVAYMVFDASTGNLVAYGV